MTVTARKWGNSIGVSIPEWLANKYDLVNGSQMEVVDGGNGIILKPVVEDDPSLDELLSMITPENEHEEIDFGKPEGAEIG
ncbi:AbrB/MazE/SpoVT family DNA-binding domain-containing protein [Virgibacillus saliphilus]|uniref:AbrB/MazE/SpoVT family DNA-binding domain-containing protein n=1 Tax=Virgibacillus saliphilus TaxID=2831674 RepID=UPI002101DEC2|nr:AbrB/MazE/SpoVT family DNA-binding domain-containing protein [Virgibacillus sp. NKC19-3]